MRNRAAPRQQRDQLGRRLCRMPSCLKPVPKGRLSYCSAECRTAFEIAYFPSYTRAGVFSRDHGVCALCGWDTQKTYRILKHARREAANDAARELGFDWGWYMAGARWQADHITECVRGGWGSGLDNLRTACTPCHKKETARLATELAVERRLNKVAPLFATAAKGGPTC